MMGAPSLMFQFHNGTINTKKCIYTQMNNACFNSTTVQLIHEEKNIIKDYILFQFHNGTINTLYTSEHTFADAYRSFNSTTVQLILSMTISKNNSGSTFQFHNGTINTSKRQDWTLPYYSFNSTTVQLIRALYRTSERIHTSFNSTTVQLIPTSAGVLTRKFMFQFHNGTINTSLGWEFYWLLCVSIPQRYN